MRFEKGCASGSKALMSGLILTEGAVWKASTLHHEGCVQDLQEASTERFHHSLAPAE